MTKEHSVLFRTGKEVKWPFFEGDEPAYDWITLDPSIETYVDHLDYADLIINNNGEGQARVLVSCKKNVIALSDEVIDFHWAGKSFTVDQNQFPLKIMDQQTRNIATIISNIDGFDSTAVGVKPNKPLPSLEASVALEPPKQNP